MSCNLPNAQPTPWIITATPPPQQVIYVTATPEFSPTPPPPLVPTVIPDAALTEAQRDLLNGDYESAGGIFQTILAQPDGAVSPEILAASAYGLGEAALRAGLFEGAVSALTDYLTRFPTDARVPWAYFLRGDANMGLSQWQAAIADFQQYLALRPGVIDSYVHERVGDAYFGLSMVPEAMAAYEQAVAAGRGLRPLLALRERVAQAYLNSGQPESAVPQYDSILVVAQNDGYRAEIMFLAGQALQAAGDPASAYSRFQQLMTTYPETNYAYQALQILLDAGQEVDPMLRAQISYAAEDYEDTITALHAATTELAASGIPVDAYLMLGRAYRAANNFAAAQTAFQTVIELFPTSPQYGAAMLEIGRTRYFSGDTLGAIEHYTRFAEVNPTLAEAPEALWRAGYLYETALQQFPEAVAIYERLGRDYPGDEWAMDGLMRGATVAAVQNDMVTAERLFAALGATGSGEPAAAAYLWLGRLAQQSGSTDQATAAFQSAAAADPGGYFSIRAEDMLNGREPFQPPAAYRFEFDEQAEQAQAEEWLRTTFGLTQTGPLWPLSPELEADPRLVAGRELWSVLDFVQAGEEFLSLLDEREEDPLVSYQLAVYLRSIDAYPESITAAANVIRRANVPTLQAPAYLARLRYPAYYRDLIVPAAEERGIDPLLMFALIRQESLFDARATAAAGEKGLTQVIPPTGDYIAAQLGWPDYQHTDLFRPYASVAFGAYYIWEQLDQFDFDVVAGLAGYNAGPGRAAEWLAASGGDPDLFMETMTIDSTRQYVQLIYEHYNVYRVLYAAL